ncbi:MAG: PilZ-like domain-containing protein [Deltaproteobacteria bacterium]
MSDFEQYAKFFPVGMRVGVGIPMQDNELFRDWAIITKLENDLVDIQLSRDTLPADVDMATGKVLELRFEKAGKGYRCSGVYIEGGAGSSINLRLTGDVNTNELREFYRIETFLPVIVEGTDEQHLDKVLTEWRNRKDKRAADEMERKEEMRQRRRERIIETVETNFTQDESEQEQKESQTSEEDLEHIDPKWNTIMASSANLSGGGFKYITADSFDIGQIVYIEAFLPTSPPRIMDCVARVAFKNRNYFVGTDQEYWNVALQFMFIDERDRDSIVKLISNLELLRIRMMRLPPLFKDNRQKKNTGLLQNIIAALIFIALVAALVFYFKRYIGSHTKNEIEQNFEGGVKIYKEKHKKDNW